MTTTRDLSIDLADFFADTTYAGLPPDAVEGAKKTIIDTLGVCLAASGCEPAVRALIDFVAASGGTPEAGVVGFGHKVPAMMAAFANGALAHCLDYDDQTPWGQHSASSLVPAVWAAAQKRGGVSGQEMIAAVAAGQDCFNRLRRHMDWRKDWNFSSVIGVFCAAAAAARVLGLDRQRIAHAIGIASMQSCGTMAVIDATGSDLRAMYAGFPAKGAVLAALLARQGLSGVPDILEGRYGIFNLYFQGRVDRAAIVDGLGENHTGGQTLYKRWPAVGTAHSHIHAIIELMREHALSADDLAQIRVHVGDYHQRMCEPIERRRAPDTRVEAKFSLPFLVAAAAVHGDLRLRDFDTAALRDPAVLACARKVTPVADPALDWVLDLPPGKVALSTHDGREFVRTGSAIPGSADNPMGWDDLLNKFSDCARSAITPWSDARIARAGELARQLDTLEDATELLGA